MEQKKRFWEQMTPVSLILILIWALIGFLYSRDKTGFLSEIDWVFFNGILLSCINAMIGYDGFSKYSSSLDKPINECLEIASEKHIIIIIFMGLLALLFYILDFMYAIKLHPEVLTASLSIQWSGLVIGKKAVKRAMYECRKD